MLNIDPIVLNLYICEKLMRHVHVLSSKFTLQNSSHFTIKVIPRNKSKMYFTMTESDEPALVAILCANCFALLSILFVFWDFDLMSS